MDLIVKICGLSDEETLDAALDAGADMVGLVFFPPSPRNILPSRAAALAARARNRAEVAALTVDMDESAIAEIVEIVAPDWLQFHGHEAPDAVASARHRFGKKIMKAIGIRDAADLAAVERHATAADRLLLDAKAPKGAVMPGGRGEAFDWLLLEGLEASLPYMLSGGVNAGNVAAALAMAHAIGVDVSSGVETAPGVKDPDLIRAFVAAARRAAATRPAERVAS